MTNKKLSPQDIRTIRLQLAQGMSSKLLAQEFGVSGATLSRIKQQMERDRQEGHAG